MYARRRLGTIAARWDARAKSWDQDLEDPACHLNEDQAYGRFLEEVRDAVARRQAFCARTGVIDVGCGTGLVLAHVASAFAWGIGVDISQQMIRVAQEKHLRQLRFLVGDCFRLSTLCPEAGAVLSRGVLLSHYGPHQGPALLEAGRSALVKGGFLVYDFLNATARAVHRHVPEDKTYYTPTEVCSMARSVGFREATILGGKERRVLVLLAE